MAEKIKINRKYDDSYYTRMMSNLSYDEILKKLSKSKKEVYDTIKKLGVASNEDIAIELNKYPHQITPRTGELRKLELIELAIIGEAVKSKQPVSKWRVKTTQEKIIF